MIIKMESKDKLKEIDFKNRTCYYFDDIIKNGDIYFVDILLDEISDKTYENVLIYNISYKTSTGPKPLRIRFDKIDGFIRVLDGEIKHLVLFDYGLFDEISDRIKYLISEKSGITDSINHNFRKISIYSYNSLPFEKILTFHNVIILIKSVVYKNKNEYYYNIVLEKSLHKDKSDTLYF